MAATAGAILGHNVGSLDVPRNLSSPPQPGRSIPHEGNGGTDRVYRRSTPVDTAAGHYFDVHDTQRMRVDLHIHSWISDGDLSPAEVTRRAAVAGLDVIAITDHDLASGSIEARAAAPADGPYVIPGIEISSRWEEREHHILGYWIDPTHPSIREHEEQAVRRRRDRMVAMVERLRALGLGVTMEDVERAAGPEARTLARPHLARALHAGGFTRFHGEAFIRYIGDGGPAFVAEGFPTPEDAIRIIHEAGGVAVWAHPPADWVEEGTPQLAAWGLDGVECYRPGTDAELIDRIRTAARRSGLFLSGGSDWHGPRRSELGDFAVDGAQLGELLGFGGIETGPPAWTAADRSSGP